MKRGKLKIIFISTKKFLVIEAMVCLESNTAFSFRQRGSNRYQNSNILKQCEKRKIKYNFYLNYKGFSNRNNGVFGYQNTVLSLGKENRTSIRTPKILK